MRRSIAALVACCALVPAALAADAGLPRIKGWVEVSTEHFTLYANTSVRKAENTVIELERFRQALQRITRGFKLGSDVPTVMLVFKNDVVYTPYKTGRDGRVRNVSGYFLSGQFGNYITLDASAGSRPMRVVFHEYFHTVMNASMGDIPVWLNEGLAEYFSTFKYNDISMSAQIGHPIDEHLQYIGRFGLLPWDQFYATTRDSPTYNEGTRQGSFYAQAWLLTHYLNADDTRMGQLGKYLSALRDGQEEDAAFSRAFGANKLEIGARAAAYLERGSSHLIFDFGEEFGEVEVASREVEAAEIYFRLGDLLARGGPRQAAEAHLKAAVEAGWPAPAAAASRGVAALYDQDPASARERFKEAISGGHESAEPYFLLAMEILEEAGADDDAAHLRVRELLASGLKYAPNHFETLVGYAQSFLFSGDDTAPAVEAIHRARAARPLDVDAMVVHAGLLGMMEAIPQAFRIVDREIRPRSGERAADAERMISYAVHVGVIEKVEAGDREGALSLLDVALEHVRETETRADLLEVRGRLGDDDTIIVATEEQAQAVRESYDAAVSQFNTSIGHLNEGRLEQALEGFDAVAASCPHPDICARAKELAEEVRGELAARAFAEKVRAALDLLNADTAKGIEELRRLEAEAPDGETRAQIRDLLARLDADRND